jgi:hypothetical protein
MTRPIRTLALVAALAAGIAGCGKNPAGPSDPDDTPPTVTGLTVACPQATMFLGALIICTASTQLSDGATRDVSSTAVWSTSTPDLVTVETGGRVTGLRSGEATIAADLDGRRATRTIRTFPNYARTFSVQHTIASCTERRSLPTRFACDSFPDAGEPWGEPVPYTFGQNGSQVSTQFEGARYGIASQTLTAELATDGSFGFTVSGSVGTVTNVLQFRLNSIDGLGLAGTLTVDVQEPLSGGHVTVEITLSPAPDDRPMAFADRAARGLLPVIGRR